MLRVIAGDFKGKKIETIKTNKTRPTTNKIKEAIFSAIQFELENSVFLDLFSGSGQMGIEALSRGAKKAIFVDKNYKCIKIIKKNLNYLDLNDKSEVFLSSAENFLKKTDFNFDIVFLDPPYESNLMEKAFNLVSEKISKNGIIICETSDKKVNFNAKNFFTKKTYSYGKINVEIFKSEEILNENRGNFNRI